MAIEIVAPGLGCTVQDQGRLGHYDVGIPPSGALDLFSALAANLLVGNGEAAGVLEAGKRLMVVSTGALATPGFLDDLLARAASASQLLIPAGAIAGLDGLGALKRAGLTAALAHRLGKGQNLHLTGGYGGNMHTAPPGKVLSLIIAYFAARGKPSPVISARSRSMACFSSRET